MNVSSDCRINIYYYRKQVKSKDYQYKNKRPVIQMVPLLASWYFSLLRILFLNMDNITLWVNMDPTLFI